MFGLVSLAGQFASLGLTGGGTISGNLVITGSLTAASGTFTGAVVSSLAGLSVVGRAANTTGDTAAITAANDAEVLRRSGTSLGFGTVATAGITDAAVTMAKLADLAGLSIIGRATNATGVPAAITGVDGNVLRVSGTALGFGAIATAGITDAAVTYAKIQNVAGLSVVGRSANSSGVSADITGADGNVLRVSGTTLGFGAIATAGITDAAVTYAKVQNVAGLSVVGRSANSSGVSADITGTAGQILRVSGTTLGFGKVVTGQITGTTTNDNATAGDLGEFVEATATAGSVGSWSTNVAKNITSINLTAGDWDVFGSVFWASGAITGTYTLAGITTTTASIPAFAPGRGEGPTMPTANAALCVPVTPARMSLSGSATVYLTAQIGFTGGTPTAGGYIMARRVR